jgi:hypothetical protein
MDVGQAAASGKSSGAARAIFGKGDEPVLQMIQEALYE